MSRVQIIAITGSLLLLLLVVELVRRRQLAEEFSALWIVSALVLLGVSVRRDLIDRLAQALDIYYGPAVLLLGLLTVVVAASLSFSVILSRQQRRLDYLTEETALLATEVRDLRDELTARAAAATAGPKPQRPESEPTRPLR